VVVFEVFSTRVWVLLREGLPSQRLERQNIPGVDVLFAELLDEGG
jgi:hypothetical protein